LHHSASATNEDMENGPLQAYEMAGVSAKKSFQGFNSSFNVR
jgi:hypothetical protein